MAVQSIETLKTWFQKGLKPLQAQFYDWMDSYWHKNDVLPVESIYSNNDALVITSPGLYIYTGNTVATWTLPSLVDFPKGRYLFKNLSSKDLTIQADGNDEIFSDAAASELLIFQGDGMKELIVTDNYWIN